MSPEELSPVGCNVQNAGAQPGSGHLSGLFTRTEMFAAIRERGLVPPTPRAFQDWVERGLLDRAAVHQGAGRNHGKQKGRLRGGVAGAECRSGQGGSPDHQSAVSPEPESLI